MICIKPMAPLGDRASGSPRLSARMTARIQDGGIENRREASATKSLIRSAATATFLEFDGCAFATLTSLTSTTAAELHRQSRQMTFNRLVDRRTAARDRAGTGEDAERAACKAVAPCLKELRMSVAFFRPEGIRATDDGCSWERAEITPIERALRQPIHQEHLMVRDEPAALPARQDPSEMIAVLRMAQGHPVDGDHPAGSADILTWKGSDMLQERNAPRQIAARFEEGCERFRRLDDDKVTDVMDVGWFHRIKPDRHACAGIPDQPRDRMEQRRHPHEDYRQAGHRDRCKARHASIFLRSIHARCCSRL